MLEFFNLCELYRKDYITYNEKERFFKEASVILNVPIGIIKEHYYYLNIWKYLFMTENEKIKALSVWETMSKHYQKALKEMTNSNFLYLYRVGKIEKGFNSLTDSKHIASLFSQEKSQKIKLVKVRISDILWSWQGDYDIGNENEYLIYKR